MPDCSVASAIRVESDRHLNDSYRPAAITVQGYYGSFTEAVQQPRKCDPLVLALGNVDAEGARIFVMNLTRHPHMAIPEHARQLEEAIESGRLHRLEIPKSAIDDGRALVALDTKEAAKIADPGDKLVFIQVNEKDCALISDPAFLDLRQTGGQQNINGPRNLVSTAAHIFTKGEDPNLKIFQDAYADGRNLQFTPTADTTKPGVAVEEAWRENAVVKVNQAGTGGTLSAKRVLEPWATLTLIPQGSKQPFNGVVNADRDRTISIPFNATPGEWVHVVGKDDNGNERDLGSFRFMPECEKGTSGLASLMQMQQR
jgi:hypothetical protein